MSAEAADEEPVPEFGRAGCGGEGSLGRTNCVVSVKLQTTHLCCALIKLARRKPTTAPSGYCRASAIWSEDSFMGRASSAVRNVRQNMVSDMMGVQSGVGVSKIGSLINETSAEW